MSNRRVRTQSIPVVGNDEINTITVDLYYNEGGMNYFSYKQEARGFYLSVSPTKIEQHRGYSSEIMTPRKGYKLLVLQVTRFSQAKLGKLAQKLPDDVLITLDDMIKRVMIENGLKRVEQEAA